MATIPREGLQVALTLARRANAEHQAIAGKQRDIVEHAIRCGESLLEAQRKVPRGKWDAWMREHLLMHPTTAYDRMRLARNAEKVRAAKPTSIEAAAAAIAKPEGRFRASERAEMFQLAYAHDVTLGDIAEAFDVSVSAVWYWVSDKNKDRRGPVRKQTRARERMALLRENRSRQMKKVSGPVSAAYSHLRRAEQALDQAIGEHARSPEERTALRRALGGCYTAEDEIVRALGMEEPRRAGNAPQPQQTGNVRRLHRRNVA